MGMPADIKRRWTSHEVRTLLDEKHHWPRYELIAGELIVTPAPGGKHQQIAFEMARILADYCDAERIGVTMMSPADLVLAPDTITQPDVFVVPNAALVASDQPFTWNVVGALLLAVEVISPGSVRVDRVEKRDFYLSAKVDAYWVIDHEARMVEQWRRDRTTPIVTRETLRWKPVGACDELAIELPGFFDGVAEKLERLPGSKE